jgi:hypothetical protein
LFQAAAVHADVVSVRIGLRAKLGDGVAVDRHAPLADVFFRGATRRDAGRGENFLKPFRHRYWNLLRAA